MCIQDTINKIIITSNPQPVIIPAPHLEGEIEPSHIQLQLLDHSSTQTAIGMLPLHIGHKDEQDTGNISY